jgi:hypothetical protein
MKQVSDLYIIRGTGYNIDGTIVEKVERAYEDYFQVRSFNPHKIVVSKSLLIHDKYLEKLDSLTKKFTYKIVITKEIGGSSGDCVEASFVIHNALRDINIEDLTSKIGEDLLPILRLEE